MVMLARSAEDLYWFGRYLERTEQTARFVDITYHRLVESPQHQRRAAWVRVLASLGLSPAEYEHVALDNSDEVMRFLVDGHPGSITGGINRLRHNARGLRELLPVELWETVNRFYLQYNELDLASEMGTNLHEFLMLVRRRCESVSGTADTTWLRSDPWKYFSMGRYLERAILIAQLLSTLPSDDPEVIAEWGAVLRSASAVQAHRMTYQRAHTPQSVAELLLTNPQVPRSVLFCINEVHEIVQSFDVNAPNTTRRTGRARANLEFAEPDALVGHGLIYLLATVHADLSGVSVALAAEHFLVPLQRGLHSVRLGAFDSPGELT